jgi:hypothetical protein
VTLRSKTPEAYHETKFLKVQHSNGEVFRASFVSSNVDHFTAISKEDSKVYIWGSGEAHLCGVKDADDKVLATVVHPSPISEFE